MPAGESATVTAVVKLGLLGFALPTARGGRRIGRSGRARGPEEAYASGVVRLSDFRIERNGNGRDVDILPAFTGTYAHGYTVTFEILPDPSGAYTLLHTSGYYLDEKSNLRIYVPQTDIKQRFPGFALNRSYTVRGTVTLDVGFGGQSGYWSPAFIEGVFPARERSQSITRQATF